jgi:site-specific recombinase XerC
MVMWAKVPAVGNAHALSTGGAVRGDAQPREPLEALLETCDGSLAGLRDRALLLFAFSSGGRRRSEVTAATLENTLREGGLFVFTLATSKTNQTGLDRPENDKPVAGRAARALSAWLAASGIGAGQSSGACVVVTPSGSHYRRLWCATSLGSAAAWLGWERSSRRTRYGRAS